MRNPRFQRTRDQSHLVEKHTVECALGKRDKSAFFLLAEFSGRYLYFRRLFEAYLRL
jgi:hypothetical protein